jgi:type IV pilus assembly protein PilA
MKKRSDKGFTLIELLVVVAIIGILAAIAIPQFSAYRKRAYDAGAKSDLRNAANGEEAYFVDRDNYVSCAGNACIVLPGFKQVSDSVALDMVATDGASPSFTGSALATKGSDPAIGKVCWSSENGGFVTCPSS